LRAQRINCKCLKRCRCGATYSHSYSHTPLARRYRHSRPTCKRISRSLHGLSNLIDAFSRSLFRKQGRPKLQTQAINRRMPSARRVLENISIDRHAWHFVTRNIFAVKTHCDDGDLSSLSPTVAALGGAFCSQTESGWSRNLAAEPQE
jgi:hypothetical protein